MRHLLPWALILLAAVLGYLLFAERGDEPVPTLPGDGPLPAADGPADREAGTLRVAEPSEVDRRAKRAQKVWQPVDPRTLPKGSLVVQPVGPDLEPIIDRRLSVIATPKGQRVAKLPQFDESTGAFRFPSVIAGTVRISVRGDHIVGTVTEAVVRAGREVRHEVHVQRGGAIRYDVITYAKTRPDQVLLELFDAIGRPAEAWFQARTSRTLTQPRRTKSITLGPEGVVFGIPPGRYKLKVTNIESEEWDEAEVKVEAGTTHEATLTVRR